MRYLHGIHDAGAEDLHGNKPGWTLVTEEIGLNTQQPTRDYRHISDRGIGVIVRWNHGYGSTGTIPTPERYTEFAAACQSAVAHSIGAEWHIIGNEPNISGERPNGVYITPTHYATCYLLCQAAIKQASPSAKVMPAAMAPYNIESGNWLEYTAEVYRLIALGGGCDGVDIHAYTRSMNPADIDSRATMGGVLGDQFSGFLTYRDVLLRAVPASLRRSPAFITEFDVYHDWQNLNTGVIRAMYSNLNAWNALPTTQKVVAGICFRWLGPPEVQNALDWEMRNKPQLLEDFKGAVASGFVSPSTGDIVTPPTEPTPQPPAQDADIDQELIDRGVTVAEADVEPGEAHWHLIRANFLNKEESGGRHHIYIESLDAMGVPVAGVEFTAQGQGSDTDGATNDKLGFDAANVPMWASEGKNGYTVYMDNGDTVAGLGMGDETPGGFNAGIHTSTILTYQQKAADSSGPTPPPAGALWEVAYVTAQAGLRLRVQPNTQAEVLVNIPFGDAVEVSGDTVDGWIKARYGDESGWLYAGFLSEQPPEVQPAPAPEQTPAPAPVPTGVIDPLVAQAILNIESGSRTHGENGKPIMRFEAHIFEGKAGDTKHFRYNEQKPWTDQQWRRNENDAWRNIHTGQQADEYEAFEFAKSLNPDAAYESISVGAGQIMGFNHARIGYPTAEAMFNSFQSSPMQTIGFINYFLSDPALVDAMRRKDWREIAKRYNGAGAVDTYAPLLEKAYQDLAS